MIARESLGGIEHEQTCCVCHEFARIPFRRCNFCGQSPSYHHGRCCWEYWAGKNSAYLQCDANLMGEAVYTLRGFDRALALSGSNGGLRITTEPLPKQAKRGTGCN